MARIDPRLLQRLQDRLERSPSQVYALIDKKVRETHLPRHLAAIALASERNINISKFASEADLAAIRGIARPATPPPTVAAVAPAQAPAQRRGGRLRRTRAAVQPGRDTTVFVVQGRNAEAAGELVIFLRALGLQPLEWVQAIRKTRQGTPYTGTVLDAAFREAAAIVVLLTPDDEAQLRQEFRTPKDQEYESRLTGQARANVLFEAGMAFGRNPDSTVLVQMGELRPFSDIGGRHVVHLSNDPAKRRELATKLENAGCRVDTSGTDWLKAGDLDL